MRITLKEKDVIKSTAMQLFGSKTKVVLFGSRAVDTAKGGDIDLLIVPPDNLNRSEFFDKKIKFLTTVQDQIGEIKMDVIVKYPDDKRMIIETAIKEGIEL